MVLKVADSWTLAHSKVCTSLVLFGMCPANKPGFFQYVGGMLYSLFLGKWTLLDCFRDSSLNKVTVLLHWSYTDAPPSAHCHGTKNGNSLPQPLACLLSPCSVFGDLCTKAGGHCGQQQPWLPPHPAKAFFLLLCWHSRLTPCMWLPHHPLPTTGFWSCTTDTTDCVGKFVTLQAKSPSKHFPFCPSSLNLSPQHTSAPTPEMLEDFPCPASPREPAGNVQGDIFQNQKAKGCPLRFAIGEETWVNFSGSSWKLRGEYIYKYNLKREKIGGKQIALWKILKMQWISTECFYHSREVLPAHIFLLTPNGSINYS